MDDLKERIIAANNKNRLINFIQELYYEDRKNENTLPELLTQLHNNRELDLVQVFKELKNSSNNHNFFTIRSIFEEILPKLKAPLQEVAACVKHLTLEAGQDMAAYTLIPPFKEFCQTDIAHPNDLYELSLSKVDEDFDHLSTAIISGTYFDENIYVNRGVELLHHESEVVRIRATYALGRITYTDEALKEKAATEIIKSSTSIQSDNMLSNSLSALSSITSESKSLRSLYLDFLKQHEDFHGEQFIHAATNLLFLEKDTISKPEESILLGVCRHTPPNNTATLRNIDFVLKRLLKQGNFNSCVAFLEHFFEINDSELSIEVFDSFIRELGNHPDTYLSQLITRWLRSRKVLLGRFCIPLLNENSEIEVKISADLSQIEANSEFGRIFLARKACGWFYHRPISATSFILSLLEGATPEEEQAIAELISDPLLIGYPGKVKNFLRELAEQLEDSKIITLLSDFEKYQSKLKEIETAKELDIPTSHKEAYYRKQSEEFSKSYEEAQKGSIMDIIGIKKSILLYGEGSIHYMYKSKDDAPVRQETQMSPISTSYEVPLLTIVDPHGIDQMLQHFRLEGCTS